MGYNYKPQNSVGTNKFEKERYEEEFKNFDTYIQNILSSYGYLLSKLDLNNNDLAYQHGLVDDHDLSLGQKLNVPSFIEMHLKNYTDELVKRAHLIGHSNGDIKGADWGVTKITKIEKTKRTKTAQSGGLTTNLSTQQRNEYFYDLIKKEIKLNGIDILEKYPKYFRGLTEKVFGSDPRPTNNSINNAKKKIREEMVIK